MKKDQVLLEKVDNLVAKIERLYDEAKLDFDFNTNQTEIHAIQVPELKFTISPSLDPTEREISLSIGDFSVQLEGHSEEIVIEIINDLNDEINKQRLKYSIDCIDNIDDMINSL